MKILVLSTGGTIGSQTKGGIISPNNKSSAMLLNLYKSSVNDDTEFASEKISDTLSENITDSFYETLINYLLRFNKADFDGIIILHGTDTLEYTSALVSMACRNFLLPVGFVSANLPLENPKSNGVANFKAAVQYIKAGGKGFFAPYRNYNGKVNIHLATRMLGADPIYDDFNSIYNCAIAEIKNDTVKFLNSSKLPSQKALVSRRAAVYKGNVKFNSKILVIKSYPGIDYSVYDLQNKNIAAVLNLAYHSGTAPSYLSEFAIKCKDMGIENYLCPVKNTESLYESADELLKAGVIPMPQITIASALAKLKIFYNSDILNKEISTVDLYYETI